MKMKNTMQAAVLHAPADLRFERVPIPQINENDVLVRVKAAGICGSDLGRIMHTGTYHFPTIPGHEFCGTIDQLGSSVEGLSIGDRVLVVPILPCFKCTHCQSGHYGQCENYNYLGSRTDGGFAEYVKAPVQNIIPLPEGISFEEGAAVEPAAVTLHGMRRIKINPGDSVCILGCGPIGLFAVQFAKIMGATQIIAVDLDPERLSLSKKLGATDTINAETASVISSVKQLSSDEGVDVTIENAGSNITQVQAISCTKKHGRILYLGTAHKDVVIPPEVFEHIVRNEITITGAWNSYSAPFPGKEWDATLEYLEQKRLDVHSLISHQLPLSDAPEIFKTLDAHQLNAIKIVFQI
ncbi:galactitol-1-phosphate 5-dehydrogenase [Eubacterium barkeri]|uniref:L-iditol 2-dehydrogenase n=1 Tax=Eubacterium barkeri TaxID=1528 RepID=A0A1H3JK50_EUBBA|nr:galactitol-1-phosphate 5-dehydrogenase [Eubacterium barkeri]SDY40302.1 L-iditol 2-dehydrogenase [Eubacterium barkeri]